MRRFFWRRAHDIASYFGRCQYYNAPFFGRPHMANYNVDAVQKVTQKLECNCNSMEILKVTK